MSDSLIKHLREYGRIMRAMDEPEARVYEEAALRLAAADRLAEACRGWFYSNPLTNAFALAEQVREALAAYEAARKGEEGVG